MNTGNAIKNKIYIFILCPPFCGSTILLKILNSSPEISTFLGKEMQLEMDGKQQTVFVHKGEGQFLYEIYAKNGKGLEYSSNRHNSEYKLPLKEMETIWKQHWDLDKPILCDKSPPFVHFAKQIETFYGAENTRFIIMNRSPYSCRWSHYEELEPNWTKFAYEQKSNLTELTNTLYLSYESLVIEPELTKCRILDFIPELKEINMDIEKVNGIAMNGNRNKRLSTDFNSRILFKKMKKTNLLVQAWIERKMSEISSAY